MARAVGPRRRSKWALTVVGALAVSSLGALPLVGGVSPMAQGAHASVAAPSEPAVPLCGVANPSGSGPGAYETPAVGGSGSSVSVRWTSVYTSQSLRGMYYDSVNGDVYINTGTSLVVATTSGTVVGNFALPTETAGGLPLADGNVAGTVVVGPSGGIYVFMTQGAGFYLVRLNSNGTLAWNFDLAGLTGGPVGMYAWHDSSGKWALAVVASRSYLLSPAGSPVTGTSPIQDSGYPVWVSPTPSGGLIYDVGADGQQGAYVHVVDSNGVPIVPSAANGVPVFGYGRTAHNVPEAPGSPFGFFQAGGAVEVGSTVYVADGGHGIDMFSNTGVFEGEAPSSKLGVVTPESPLYYDPTSQSLLFFNSTGVVSVPLSSIQALVEAPASPLQGLGDTLGIGAGLSTGVTAGYFAPGGAPTVTASFDPWWRYYPDPLALSYWVADSTQVTSNQLPSPAVVPLSWAGVSSGSPLQFQLGLPAATPGVYLVNADLVDEATSTTVGSTCLTYSVGMAGDTLDFSALAPGADYGGPAPERGVQLAAELGTGLMREQLSLTALLPTCTPANITAADCGPSALTNWSSVDPATEEAAVEAKALGVNFEVQVGQNNTTNVLVLDNGFWQQDVEAILEHFAQSAPDLEYVEAWNEPNAAGYSATSYLSGILEPFYEAVQTANAADGTHLQVVGASVVGMDNGAKGWWGQFAKAGGFSYLNVVGFHPYPGYDRSFEEEGSPQFIAWLKGLMAGHGAASLPLWDTEQGWWTDGEETFFDVGNWAPREWMWLRSLGVDNWDYFITEGDFGAFGLIRGDDSYVTPGAIGLMTVSNLLGERPFLKQLSLGIPHAYGMLFGPPADGSSSNDILAVWTDDLKVNAEVALSSGPSAATIYTTSALGAPGSIAVSTSSPTPLQLSGAPLYLEVPADDTLTVGPAEPFGPNLALAATGATASASSAWATSWNSPSAVIQGTADAEGEGSLGSTPAWVSSQTDSSPWVQVDFPGAETVDRVIVSTSTLGSVVPGLRNYSVELEEPSGWVTVGSVVNEYFNRMEEVSFPAASGVTAVRVVITALDYNDTVGGLPPSWWVLASTDYAVVYSVEAYGPGSEGAPTTTTTLTGTDSTTTSSSSTTAISSTTITSSTVPIASTTTVVSAGGATTSSSVPSATILTATTTTTMPTTTAVPATTSTTSSAPTAPGTANPGPTPTSPADLGGDPYAGEPGLAGAPVWPNAPDGTPTSSSGLSSLSSSTTGLAGTTTTTALAVSKSAVPGTVGASHVVQEPVKVVQLSVPHKLPAGTRFRFVVALGGKKGYPTGVVEAKLDNKVVCRALLRKGSASCRVPVPFAAFVGTHRATELHAREDLVDHAKLTLIYAGDTVYRRWERTVTLTVVLPAHPLARPKRPKVRQTSAGQGAGDDAGGGVQYLQVRLWLGRDHLFVHL